MCPKEQIIIMPYHRTSQIIGLDDSKSSKLFNRIEFEDCFRQKRKVIQSAIRLLSLCFHSFIIFSLTFRFQRNCKGVREAWIFGRRRRRRRFWQGDRHPRRTLVRILKEN